MTGPTEAPDVVDTWREMAEMSASMNLVPPKQPKKVQYTYRAPERLYEAVQAKAAENGETVADVIRRAFERYVEKD